MRHTAGVAFHSLPVLSRILVIMDPIQLTVKVDERNIQHLSQLEFRLLSVLLTYAGQIIPTDNIGEHVWECCGDRNRDFVWGLVQRLRSKVELDNKFHVYFTNKVNFNSLLNLRGFQYFLAVFHHTFDNNLSFKESILIPSRN